MVEEIIEPTHHEYIDEAQLSSFSYEDEKIQGNKEIKEDYTPEEETKDLHEDDET